MKFTKILGVAFLLILSNCAKFGVQYSPEVKNWESHQPDPDIQPEHSMFLIGDAGNAPMGESLPALDFLKEKLEKASANSSVLFMGDNIYPGGLPPISQNEEYEVAKHRLETQLKILDNFKGKPVFMPGNHDWWHYGVDGLKRQEDYVNNYLNEEGIDKENEDWEQYFYPGNGCSGPEVIELNDQLVVVVIDSHWWLVDWEKEAKINQDCDARTREVFGYLLDEILRKYRYRNVVITMHHPVYTYGPHGGYHALEQHFFPLREINHSLFIPLPVIGTIGTILRSQIGTKTDIVHKNYKKLITTITKSAEKYGNFIFTAGHEHSMQYIENDGQYFVVSGAGSKSTQVRLGPGSLFAYGKYGFSQLDFYKDGSVWVKAYAAEEKKLIFQRKIKEALPPVPVNETKQNFPEFDSEQDTIVLYTLKNSKTRKDWTDEYIIKNYRDLASEYYRFPALRLSQYKGGVYPVSRAGGTKTNGLRLEDNNGRQYIMRAVTQGASRLSTGFSSDLQWSKIAVKDNFISRYPFGVITISELAKASEIYHTNPGLFYVPKQPTLGVHNDLYGGEVYQIEERPTKDWSDMPSMGYSKKIVSTATVFDKITKNHQHNVDQKWVLRSRLFDLLINDWDRYDDQWRWASVKLASDSTFYRPISRERVRPFVKYDDPFISFVRTGNPYLTQLSAYQPVLKNVKWSVNSARYFDKSFLNQMTWEDWQSEVKFLHDTLTDEVIEQAFSTWPRAARQTDSKPLIKHIKNRRDKLLALAVRQYALISKKIDIYGTNKKERFIIERLNDEETRVTSYHITAKKGIVKEKSFDRVFKRSETKEISIYGLGNDDTYIVTGKVRKGITLRLIGGDGNDVYRDSSKVGGLSKKTLVYDFRWQDNVIEKSDETKNKMSNHHEQNVYDRFHMHYNYNFTMPFPILAYNSDDGFVLGADTYITTYKFKHSPYGAIHRLKAHYSFDNQGLEFAYSGDFNKALGEWDLLLNTILRSPKYATTYFGKGNETVWENVGEDYNKFRQSLIHLHPSVKYNLIQGSSRFVIGPLYERTKIEDTPDRFITSGESQLPDHIFESKNQLGLKASLEYDNVDNIILPTKGVRFAMSYKWMANLEDAKGNYRGLDSRFALYLPIDGFNRFILATKVGFDNKNGDFYFFQAPTLGGGLNLRGYRNQRFYGNTTFYHNTDLRIRLFRSKNIYLPFTFGLYGGFDYGRVWADGTSSSKWHQGYGGGLWVAPVDYIAVTFGYFRSAEDERFRFQVGFDF